MANDLLVIDIKASGLCDQSYPISIGVAGAEDQRWSWLIYPLETWHGWSHESESEHGITRDKLLEEGRDGFIICKEMNAIFKGLKLVASTSFVIGLLTKIFKDLSIIMSFEVLEIETLCRADRTEKKGFSTFIYAEQADSTFVAGRLRDKLVSNGFVQI